MMKVPSSRTMSVTSLLNTLGRVEETSARLYMRASFEVRAETEYGDYIVITGSSEQLGLWQPERGLRMATDEGSYPVWRCEPLLRCAAEDIEYKFVIMREQGAPQWEPLPFNRRLSLAAAVDDVQVVATWGSESPWRFTPSVHSPNLTTSPAVVRRNYPPSSQEAGRCSHEACGTAASSASSATPEHLYLPSSASPEHLDEAAPPPGLTERLLVVRT
jgi:hypothetical protein